MTEDNVQLKQEWVDKYCPKTLDDYVVDEELRKYFKDMISSRSLTSQTFCGIQGSGKTTLCKIICNELNAEVLFIRCATEGTIDTLRSKVEPFCNAMSIEGRPKIVVLDELDAATSTTGSGSSFQLGLRTLIEAAQSDTRFLCTANYGNKILPAVLSRCPLIPLKYSQKDLLIHVKKILDAEGISYTKETLKQFIESAFHFYPDCRKIIKHLQLCCASGTLEISMSTASGSDKDNFIKEIVENAMSSKSILEVRRQYLQDKEKVSDFIEAASLLFNYVVDNGLADEDCILKFTDLLYQINVVVDKEITFFSMIVALRKGHS